MFQQQLNIFKTSICDNYFFSENKIFHVNKYSKIYIIKKTIVINTGRNYFSMKK